MSRRSTHAPAITCNRCEVRFFPRRMHPSSLCVPCERRVELEQLVLRRLRRRANRLALGLLAAGAVATVALLWRTW